jgi:cysteinyl-tRNA synthetase
MEDDLNTPRAIAALFDLVRAINRAAAGGRSVAKAQATLRELAGVLGFMLESHTAAAEAAPFIDLLVELRADLRKARQFELADRVREGLGELGVELKDGPAGTKWTLG